ncbi:thioesterase [Streptosporangium nondiastaticum]|uniref:Thioesterase n=1 Tax=Streptosporangium nondiastaticum TaxID=35764 RepID=A0A9X7PJL3_9ACTN|nr:alpha/beta fold hydrolase [Streptosporangium nondiastaticum]PSJ30355.1 thioesterase [Streptosporangium nondiastaticum]
MNTDTALWLHRTAPVTDPVARLICFPHAGGSASFFRDWGQRIPGVEVYAVRYPGRAERLGEPLATDLRELARAVADAAAPLADLPLALFGHSMGAPIALETAAALEARGIDPVHLFASGSCDAAYPSPEEWADPGEEDDPAVIERLLTLGGTDPELAADPEFQELVLPYVRADANMFHAYTTRPGTVVRCPVTTIAGDADADTDRRPWSELTTGGVREQSTRGDHFYLVANPPHSLIRETLAAVPARPAA